MENSTYNVGTNLWYSPKGIHIFHLMLGVPSKVWWFKVTHRPKRPIVQYGIWCEFRGEMPELLQYPYISLKSFLNIFYFCCFVYVLSEICSGVIEYPHISSSFIWLKIRSFFCFLTTLWTSQGYLAHHKAEQFASKGLRQAEARSCWDKFDILLQKSYAPHEGGQGLYMRLGYIYI